MIICLEPCKWEKDIHSDIMFNCYVLLNFFSNIWEQTAIIYILMALYINYLSRRDVTGHV